MAAITIDDVAARAGVSIKTVSRVLNREPHVRPATRDRVLAAVDLLNYRPNASARALAGSRSYLVGLFFDNPSPGYNSQIEQGAMSACRDAGYFLLVEQLPETGAALRERVAALLSAVRMDGVILTPPLCDRTELLDALAGEGVPCVRIAPTIDLGRSPFVYMDDRRAAYEMTVHLQGLGHRDIAFITGPADHRAAANRREGFEQAMRDAGLPVRPERVRQGAFSFLSGWECAEQLLDSADRPTAIFAGNDDMALGVMAVANRLHIDIPGTLSLAGFDDSPGAQVVWPQLTTVRQPVAQMAQVAAALLTGAPPDRDAARGRQLDFEIVVRQSSAVRGG
ncbi:LacI family transcriptional regulator [Caulobacter ginsengisoli]|uniref:LacI family transcriptional regulator n=1 Tax=Caulobacter ginsengisoli TaxID=400775 RepID=A0ABU0IQU4_9CAUL|nr:LacI family DNA-binding transcriptional regulator [Caulobacter ginsengisoli]MDQ0464329.1 LacI family transcriptional regulator [Caulobacter ginsengisoli]